MESRHSCDRDSACARTDMLHVSESESMAYWVKIEFGAHHKRPCRRCDVLLAAAIHILLAWHHSALISVPCSKKQGFKSSYCLFFHLPSSIVQDDEIGMVLPFAYFPSCLICQWRELYNDQDGEIGIVPPLAYLASGGIIQ